MSKKICVSLLVSLFLFQNCLAPELTIYANEENDYIEENQDSSTLPVRNHSIKKGTYYSHDGCVGMNRPIDSNLIRLNLEPIKEVYHPGETLTIRGSLKKDDKLLKEKNVEILISKNQEKIHEMNVQTGKNGTFIHFYPLKLKVGPDPYTLTVTYKEKVISKNFLLTLRPLKDDDGVPPIEPVTPKSRNVDEDLSTDSECTVKDWGSTREVPVTKQWSIHFSEQMDKSTLIQDKIYILDKEGNKMNSSLEVNSNGQIVIIKPLKPLNREQSYTLWVTNGVKNLQNEYLSEHVKLDFHTK